MLLRVEHAHGAASRPVRTDAEAQPTWRDFSRHGLGPGLRVELEPPAAVALFIFQVVVGFCFTHDIPRASFPSGKDRVLTAGPQPATLRVGHGLGLGVDGNLNHNYRCIRLGVIVSLAVPP